MFRYWWLAHFATINSGLVWFLLLSYTLLQYHYSVTIIELYQKENGNFWTVADNQLKLGSWMQGRLILFLSMTLILLLFIFRWKCRNTTFQSVYQSSTLTIRAITVRLRPNNDKVYENNPETIADLKTAIHQKHRSPYFRELCGNLLFVCDTS